MKKIREKMAASYSSYNQGALMLRLLAGGYIFYLGIQLLRTPPEQSTNIFLTLVIPVLFLLFGGVFFLLVCLELLRRHYQTLVDASRSSMLEGNDPLTFKNYEKKIMDLLDIEYDMVVPENGEAPEVPEENASPDGSEEEIKQ